MTPPELLRKASKALDRGDLVGARDYFEQARTLIGREFPSLRAADEHLTSLEAQCPT